MKSEILLAVTEINSAGLPDGGIIGCAGECHDFFEDTGMDMDLYVLNQHTHNFPTELGVYRLKFDFEAVSYSMMYGPQIIVTNEEWTREILFEPGSVVYGIACEL